MSNKKKTGKLQEKRVKVVREQQDNHMTVRLEESPKWSTCSKCRKPIPAGKRRYKVMQLGCWTYICHCRCAPTYVRGFVRGYPSRDFAKEACSEAYERLERALWEIQDLHPSKARVMAFTARVTRLVGSFRRKYES